MSPTLPVRFIKRLAILVVLLGMVASWYLYKLETESMRSRSVEQAQIMARSIDPADILALSGSEDDVTSPVYVRVKDALMRLRLAVEDTRFVYLLGTNAEEQVFFYADSEDAASPDYSPPGQIYYEATPELMSAFSTPEGVFEGPVTDRWGTWISAYAPIYDAEGNTVAIIGLDVSAKQYLMSVLLYASFPLVVAVLIALLLIMVAVANARAQRRA